MLYLKSIGGADELVERRTNVPALAQLAILTRSRDLTVSEFLNIFVKDIAPAGFRSAEAAIIEVRYGGERYSNRIENTDEEGKTRKLWRGKTQIGTLTVAFEGRDEESFLPYEHDLIKSFASVLSLYLANREIIASMEKITEEVSKTVESKLRQELIVGFSHLVHDIRSPASGLEQMTDTLQRMIVEFEKNPRRDTLNEMVLAFQNMHTSAKRINSLVDDVMDYAEIEAHTQSGKKEVVVLSSLIHEQFKAFEIMYAEKDLSLDLELDPSIFQHIKVDPKLVSRVLQNLLNNAFKFTNTGGTTVSVKAKERHADKTCLEWVVRDTGVGIAPEDMQNMFKPFFKGSRKGKKIYKSTGLGLVSMKRLLELAGGTITVESVVDQGTTFTYTLWVEELKPPLGI